VNLAPADLPQRKRALRFAHCPGYPGCLRPNSQK
jgi:hypothetical protein